MHAFSHLRWGCVFVEKPISLAKVHVPHAMIHLCRVDHCHGVLMPLKLRLDHFVSLFNLYFNKYLLMTLYNWKKVKVSLSLPWIHPKNLKIPTIFNLKQVTRLAVFGPTYQAASRMTSAPPWAACCATRTESPKMDSDAPTAKYKGGTEPPRNHGTWPCGDGNPISIHPSRLGGILIFCVKKWRSMAIP